MRIEGIIVTVDGVEYEYNEGVCGCSRCVFADAEWNSPICELCTDHLGIGTFKKKEG